VLQQEILDEDDVLSGAAHASTTATVEGTGQLPRPLSCIKSGKEWRSGKLEDIRKPLRDSAALLRQLPSTDEELRQSPSTGTGGEVMGGANASGGAYCGAMLAVLH